MNLSLLLSDFNLLNKENIDSYLKEKKIKLNYQIVNTLIVNEQAHIEIPSGIQFKTSKGMIEVFVNNHGKSMDQEFLSFNNELIENTSEMFTLVNLSTSDVVKIKDESLFIDYLRQNNLKIKNKFN